MRGDTTKILVSKADKALDIHEMAAEMLNNSMCNLKELISTAILFKGNKIEHLFLFQKLQKNLRDVVVQVTFINNHLDDTSGSTYRIAHNRILTYLKRFSTHRKAAEIFLLCENENLSPHVDCMGEAEKIDLENHIHQLTSCLKEFMDFFPENPMK